MISLVSVVTQELLEAVYLQVCMLFRMHPCKQKFEVAIIM